MSAHEYNRLVICKANYSIKVRQLSGNSLPTTIVACLVMLQNLLYATCCLRDRRIYFIVTLNHTTYAVIII